VIQRGIDIFFTAADGKTFHDFSYNPIPAGFFCDGSEAFTGRVALKGLPLATQLPGQLQGADTVVERLDDAALDNKGVGETRTRFRALSLVSISPIKTACGAFNVYVSLRGEQRVTTMKILRTEAGGGSFVAPLAVDVRLAFVPVKPAGSKSPRKLELTGSFIFPATPLPWSLATGAVKGVSAAVVDTDGDLIPDTLLPGTSNFLAGQSPGHASMQKIISCSCCPATYCHADDGENHCNFLPMCPNTESCC
jgi:hypothetical protein